MTHRDQLPLVSILIPSYNHEEYIIDCLKSLYNQDYNNFEVIIRDDGSRDNTPLLIHDFIANEINTNNIHTIVEYGENIGVIKSLNWMLRNASGTIIMGLASDDIFLPGRIKYAVEMHKRYPDFDLVACNGQVITDKGEIIRESFYKQNSFNLEFGIIEYKNLEYKSAMNLELAGFGISYKKSLLKPINYQFPETLLYEDGYETFLASVQNGAIRCARPVIKYRRSTNSISRINNDLNNDEVLNREYSFLKMFLSLEVNKYDYLTSNIYINKIIEMNKVKAIHYLLQKIIIIKLKIDTIENKFILGNWLKLLFLIYKSGVEQKKILKVSLLYVLRRKFKAILIREHKNRASIL